MQKIPEVTHWITVSVDLGAQFFPQKLNIATAVMVFRNTKQYKLYIKEMCQSLQTYMNDVAESKKNNIANELRQKAQYKVPLSSARLIRFTLQIQNVHFIGCV